MGAAKTDAGVRWVPLMPALRDELLARKASTFRRGPDEFVFSTRTGRRLSRDNTRSRILAEVIEAADAALEADDHTPLPERRKARLERAFSQVAGGRLELPTSRL